MTHTCGRARQGLLADDEGLDIGVGSSRAIDVVEGCKVVFEIGAEEGEKGTGPVYSDVEWLEKMRVRFLGEKFVDWRELSAGRRGNGAGYLLRRR